ncbi:LysR substrate-binding domain-containing protein [Agrobacterium tumefaciens]|uniref:LysR substrate-binding domain-containing protein n=1 Tax=Agrobacterium tumefaciens TaxID=358 RepID=UPI00287C50D0|nr:LysR substrate-binding domain-containing protein [Agrobacterium tumefaciens]MDS7593900.1 LysR substrate-binding domain-containing protein [Agrobacterium tumefaciens]
MLRSFGNSTHILVASPQITSQIGDVQQLVLETTLSTTDDRSEVNGFPETDDGRAHTFPPYEPRIGCADVTAVITAAIAGLGVDRLPDHTCRQALDEGKLGRVLPAWRGMKGLVHLVFLTRLGLPPCYASLSTPWVRIFPRILRQNKKGGEPSLRRISAISHQPYPSRSARECCYVFLTAGMPDWLRWCPSRLPSRGIHLRSTLRHTPGRCAEDSRFPCPG